jgi:hypothetical protein
MKHATNQRPITSAIQESNLQRAIEISTLNQVGAALDASHFPDEVFGARHSLERHYHLPDLFCAGAFWVVSQAAADIMHQFDLGTGSLHAVRVLKKDRVTPIGDNWFCINFGNPRPLVIPAQSERLEPGPQDRYNFPVTLADDQLVVSAEALQPPDIWVDPQLWDNFFVSHGLREALRKAKLSSRFYLTRCRVAD